MSSSLTTKTRFEARYQWAFNYQIDGHSVPEACRALKNTPGVRAVGAESMYVGHRLLIVQANCKNALRAAARILKDNGYVDSVNQLLQESTKL